MAPYIILSLKSHWTSSFMYNFTSPVSMQYCSYGALVTFCTPIAISPDTHLHLSEVKHLRVKCLAQGHNIDTTNVLTLRGEKHDISLKILHLASLELARKAATNCKVLRSSLCATSRFSLSCPRPLDSKYVQTRAGCISAANVIRESQGQTRKRETFIQCWPNAGPAS